MQNIIELEVGHAEVTQNIAPSSKTVGNIEGSRRHEQEKVNTVASRENRGNGEEALLENKMNEYFPEMMKERNPPIKNSVNKQ